MPQNTPMKRQFTTIDGRTVMSNLPQHWGGNDWTITGVDNPLPVGNYVQTESGVWIPQKGSDDGAADVRLTGSNVEVLKSFINNDYYTQTDADFFRRWGENDSRIAGQTLPVDITGHTKRMIYIRNGYDVALRTIRVSFVHIPKAIDSGGVLLAEVELKESIPAGGELLIDDSVLPQINQPFGGIFLNIIRDTNTPPSTGTHTIIFMGAK